MADVIYQHRPVSRRMWLLPIVLWIAATVAMLLTSQVELDTFQVTVSVIGPGALFGIWLLTLWSINRYGAVTLTRESLRVGRHTIAVAEIEPQWVRMLAGRADPALAQRIAPHHVSAERQARRDRGQLLGGAYGTVLGDDLVTLELHGSGQRRVSVPTRDRRGLLAGLVTALDQPE
ncbi:hypothetical protein AB0F43_11390 [Kribbella sp. NPDC023972]|uniref:hypothetical protein n=1 Tax=Kribbella sp. NPDC023972 TaxID=3154795 RepID=UPI003403B154